MIADVTAGWLTANGSPAGEDAHAVPLGGRQHVELDAADEQRVGGCSVRKCSSRRSRAVHGAPELRGEDDVVAAALERLADDLLRLAG